MEVRVANEPVFNVFMLRALEEKIKLSELEFYYEDMRLECDPWCGIDAPTNLELGVNNKINNQILNLSYKKMERWLYPSIL